MTETKKCECGNEIFNDCTMCFECMERQLALNTRKPPSMLQSGRDHSAYRHDDNQRARIDRLMIRRAKRREAQQQ